MAPHEGHTAAVYLLGAEVAGVLCGSRPAGRLYRQEGPRKIFRGPSACVLFDGYRDAGNCRILLLRLLPAETVEFSVSCASEKSMPFVRSKSENGPLGVPAVAYTDLATGQARDLDAVTVRETQRALDPVRS
jgi:hypothetical protein